MNILKRILGRYRNFRKRTISAQSHMDHVSQRVGLFCPKCSQELYSITGQGSGMQLYFCRSCNYQGSLGLPTEKKMPKNMYF